MKRIATTQTQALVNLAVEAAPHTMVMVDQGGQTVLVSTQTVKLFGYKREELLGQRVEMLLPERFRLADPEQRRVFFAAPRARMNDADCHLYDLRKDASEVPLEIGLEPAAAAAGSFSFAPITDVTERR